MRLIILLLTTCFFLKAYSQTILPMVYDTLPRNQEIVFNGFAGFSSTAIQNSLSSFFLKGGEIPEEVRQTNYDNHSNYNRLGFAVLPELTYINYGIHLFKMEDWGIRIAAGSVTSGSIRYTKGLFGLTFLGNEPYLGDKVDLSNTGFNYFSAHKIGFGLIHGKSKSSITLNAYGIRNSANGYFENSYFQQDSLGYNATVGLQGRLDVPSRSTYYKGVGVGIDVDFIVPINLNEKKSYVQFKVQNLGVGFMTDKNVRYRMDTTINFNGFQISDLLADGAVINNGTTTLDKIGLSQDTVTAKPFALPFTLQVGKIIDETNTKLIQSYFGIRATNQVGAIPLAYLGVQVRPLDWLRVGINGSYGGYAKFQMGMYCQAKWDKINVGIATTNLVGLISKRGYGQGYALQLNYRI